MKISQIQQNEKIEIKMPKSFLVTALEPSANLHLKEVLKVCVVGSIGFMSCICVALRIMQIK